MANKVYNKKGKVHPSPPFPTDHHLSLFLPAAILAVATSLPLHDKEVLTYFLSCSDSTSRLSTRRRACHAPQFECSCFGCYVSFWSRWDSSNNRHVIDEIIEAFEEHERRAVRGRKGRERKKRGAVEVVVEGDKGMVGAMNGETVDAGGSREEVERGLVRSIGTSIGFKIWNFLDRITM